MFVKINATSILTTILMNISSSIFKAYDIRGIVESELTPEIVKLIGKAIGSESIAKGERGVVVGRDGRLSGRVIRIINLRTY